MMFAKRGMVFDLYVCLRVRAWCCEEAAEVVQMSVFVKGLKGLRRKGWKLYAACEDEVTLQTPVVRHSHVKSFGRLFETSHYSHMEVNLAHLATLSCDSMWIVG